MTPGEGAAKIEVRAAIYRVSGPLDIGLCFDVH